MHLSEGILSAPVLIAGGALAVAGVGIGLRRLDHAKVPQAALLSAAFFVASLIHVPVGPSSAHLILNGLLGAILGWAAFPAIFVALLLQAALFQFGGFTVLGINTFSMAAPAVLLGVGLHPLIMRSGIVSQIASFVCGAGAVLLSGLIVALALVTTNESFFEAAWAIIVANSAIMVIEGVITVFAVAFLKQVKPELLGMATARPKAAQSA